MCANGHLPGLNGYNRNVVERQDFDFDYLRRLAAGDEETESKFVQYFGKLLSIKLRPRLRNTHLVEDVKQETFLRVLTIIRRDGIERPGALGAVVNSVCNNVLFEVYRSESKFADPPHDGPSAEESAENSLLDDEERKRVRQVLEELPQKDQAILRAIFFEEQSHAAVAQQFQVDREYLRVLLHRAKLRFRALYLEADATSRRPDDTNFRPAALKKG